MFYFAGHGAQGRPALERDIDNYLIPRNTALISEVDLESEALALSRVSATLKPTPRGAMVLILDACRDFALPAANRSGAVTRGLTEARAAPGTMIAYATSPGSTALDGPAGGNGPYARALAAEVRGAQGATLEQVFISVRNKVLAETRDTQLPWENSSLRRSVTLGVTPISVATVIDRSERPPPPAPTSRPGDTFRECDLCPEMVMIPAGSFMMGSPPSEAGRGHNEDDLAGQGGNQVRVTIPRPFAVGKFEITFAEWDACTADGGCVPPEEEEPYHPHDAGLGRNRQPVVFVSWSDAKRYVRWLNRKVGGKAYRLLSEAEWEYAARAGTTTPFSFGSAVSTEQVNFGRTQGEGGKPMPVGSFPANSFGLHDMHGNVMEWVEDLYSDSLSTVPLDGSANTQIGGGRIIRGGSFHYPANMARSSDRLDARTSTRKEPDLGFRVARTIAR